jgi:O-succinylbenzoate synthase
MEAFARLAKVLRIEATYRTLPYVRGVTNDLAAQLVEMSENPPADIASLARARRARMS